MFTVTFTTRTRDIMESRTQIRTGQKSLQKYGLTLRCGRLLEKKIILQLRQRPAFLQQHFSSRCMFCWSNLHPGTNMVVLYLYHALTGSADQYQPPHGTSSTMSIKIPHPLTACCFTNCAFAPFINHEENTNYN